MERENQNHHYQMLDLTSFNNKDQMCIKKSTTLNISKEKHEASENLKKRRHTCLNFHIDAYNLVRLMSENVYSGQHLKNVEQVIEDDNDDSIYDENSDDEEILVGNRKYSINKYKIKKLSKQLSDTSVNQQKDFKQGNIVECDTSSQSTAPLNYTEKSYSLDIYDDSININNSSRRFSQHVFQNLINKYYTCISENCNSYFEKYVVNNLTVISYMQMMISDISKSIFLTEDNTKKMNSLDRSKKILFLDLDETLVHSDFQLEYDNHDAEVIINPDGTECKLKLIFRPYLHDFLKYCKEKFNVILFTAGLKDYADPIVEVIDPNDEYFDMRLYRDSCIEFNNIFIKDLSILNTFGLKDMIIIDNCIYSFALNLRNGVLITSFYNSDQDKELLNVLNYLDSRLIDSSDIRMSNESFFGFELLKNFMYENLIKEGII